MYRDLTKCKKLEFVGTFSTPSGVVFVTDPCYEPGTWCQGSLPVGDHVWNAYITRSDEGDWGNRVASLLIVRSDIDNESHPWLEREPSEVANFEVGVDSGQAGFFDSRHYHPKDEAWYDRVCNATYKENPPRSMGGLVTHGVASSSGYGDGSYSCYVWRAKGVPHIIAAEIVFIGDYEEEEA